MHPVIFLRLCRFRGGAGKGGASGAVSVIVSGTAGRVVSGAHTYKIINILRKKSKKAGIYGKVCYILTSMCVFMQ